MSLHWLIIRVALGAFIALAAFMVYAVFRKQ